jgi:hypothetical protein
MVGLLVNSERRRRLTIFGTAGLPLTIRIVPGLTVGTYIMATVGRSMRHDEGGTNLRHWCSHSDVQPMPADLVAKAHQFRGGNWRWSPS